MRPGAPVHGAAKGLHARSANRRERTWQAAVEKYLPLASPESIWRLSRGHQPGDPDQGWKLHVAATILSAARVLTTVAPELHTEGVLFKAPCTLAELRKLNCGYFYGTSQIGKCITVYPRDPGEAARLASRLDELTRGIPGPAVPFERPYRHGSRVFYRYGSYRSQDGDARIAGPVLRTPSGELVPDQRTDVSYEPPWSPSPFPKLRTPQRRSSRFQSDYLVYQALVQRGKGGVFTALDLSDAPPRLCVVKEGRRHGETGWDGQDGRARARAEELVLRELAAAGVEVPAVYQAFEEQRHAYLVIEYVGEHTLEDLVRESRILPMSDALALSAEMAHLVSKVHEAGWAWRDCKLRNVVVDPSGALRLIDFEGACPVGSRGLAPWGSEGYVAPEWLDPAADPVSCDLFALGVSCYQILVGSRSLGAASSRVAASPIGRRRRGLDPEVKQLISGLLDTTPGRRPSARTVAEVLSATAAS